MSEIGRNFRTRRDQKAEIKIKINLIYYLKLKSNVVGRQIRRKTQILTRDSVRIDLIALRIKGFSFREFEDDRWHLKKRFLPILSTKSFF